MFHRVLTMLMRPTEYLLRRQVQRCYIGSSVREGKLLVGEHAPPLQILKRCLQHLPKEGAQASEGLRCARGIVSWAKGCQGGGGGGGGGCLDIPSHKSSSFVIALFNLRICIHQLPSNV